MLLAGSSAEESASSPEPVPATDAARAGSAVSRAGFVVSRAVGGAIVRNRVRRRLRHLVRDRLPSLPAGSAIVVRALPEAARRGYQELGADLDAALAAAMRPRDGGRGPRGGGR
jgi:ribonuclease P protein component